MWNIVRKNGTDRQTKITDRWTDRCEDGLIHGWMEERKDRSIDWLTDRWIDQWMDQWMDRWMDWWIHRGMDRQTDTQTDNTICPKSKYRVVFKVPRIWNVDQNIPGYKLHGSWRTQLCSKYHHTTRTLGVRSFSKSSLVYLNSIKWFCLNK